MPKTLVETNLGRRSDPQEVRDLRQSNYDMVEELGFPVVFKHRWNVRDLELGLVERCPYADESVYGGDHSWDDICFGTGFVGGFADGQIVYVMLADAPTQIIRPGPEGTLIFDQHPMMSAPWLPEMGDGDLIILADFDPRSWEILDMHERYVLNQVNPTTMRGPGFKSKSSPSLRHRVGQSAQVDKLPWGHPFYDVPIVFDTDILPDDDDADTPGLQTSHEVAVRVRGKEVTFSKSFEREIWVRVAGDNTNKTCDVRVTGEGGGIHFHF